MAWIVPKCWQLASAALQGSLVALGSLAGDICGEKATAKELSCFIKFSLSSVCYWTHSVCQSSFVLGMQWGMIQNPPLIQESWKWTFNATSDFKGAEIQETSKRVGNSQTFLMHQKGRGVSPSLPLSRFSLKWSNSICIKACANVCGSVTLS